MEKKYILKYRIEGELGKGGMSRVYLGVEPVTGLRVAIKVLNQDLAEDASMRERFLVEAQWQDVLISVIKGIATGICQTREN